MVMKRLIHAIALGCVIFGTTINASAQQSEFTYIEQDESLAQLIEHNGLVYRISMEPTDENAFGRVVLVSWKLAGEEYKYKGDIVVPTAIQNGDGEFADKYRVGAFDNNLFDDCDELTSVTFPENCKGITIYALSFKNTPKLKSVAFPKAGKGAGAFNCIHKEAFLNSGIEEITIPDGVVSVYYDAFKGSKLRRITLPASVRDIGPGAFSDTPLTAITFSVAPKVKNDYYSHGVFANCNELTTVEFLQPVDRISNYFFSDITSPSLTIKGVVTELGDGCFDNCKFKTLNLPEGLEVIGTRCFNDCSDLENLVLPTTLETIKRDAFRGCPVGVDVPEGVNVEE